MAEELEKSLLQVSESEFREMFAIYNLTLEEVKEIRGTILEYCSKQEHLKDCVPYLEKTYMIEKALQYVKGSVEQCKQKVESILTARSYFSEMVFDRRMEEFKAVLDNGDHIVLPKLIPNEHCGITISRFKKQNIDDLTFLSYVRYTLLIGEYRTYRYMGVAERYIIDLEIMPISVLTIINPIMAKKSLTLVSKIYGSRIKGIHFINAPSYVDKIVAILKYALKDKLVSRIHVHKNHEELYEYIPKELLPKDYGGDQESITVLAEKWQTLYRSAEGRQKILDLDKVVSDESKRLNSELNNEYLGITGTFKKLEVD